MSERLISVITAFYNSEEFIEVAHQSLLNQTYKNWEWICVDDCSTDNTLNFLYDWAKEDSRIKVIARNLNGGNAARTVNSGIHYCNGSHIIFIGHDDELTPNTLEEIVKRIDETDADIIIPDAEFVNDLINPGLDNFKMIGISPEKNDKKYEPNDRSIVLSGEDACKLSLNWRIHTWACYSSDIVKKIRFFEDAMNGDEYSTREFLLNAKKVAFSKGTYRYLRRPTSITSKISIRYFQRFPVEEKLHEMVKTHSFGKKYEKIVNNSTLNIYFDYKMKYLTKYEVFTEAERIQINEVLKLGEKIINKYCSPIQIVKINIKIFKYTIFYKIWKSLDKKLKQKALI